MDIPYYSSIPVRVQALQVTRENIDTIAAWTRGQMVTETDALVRSAKFVAINIPTLHGVIRAGEGQMVLLDEHGEWKVMSLREFQERYQ